MRVIIYNGKGGVGKTSVSSATARRLAKKGHRTIIMSVDTAHSLSDSLGVKVGAEVTHIEKNLDALELDIVHEMKTKWSSIEEYIAAFMLSQGMNDVSAEEMAIMPGMEMVAALFYVLQFNDSGEYDVVVIDTPPTGETLRLLSFPDVSNWYIDKVYGLVKRMLSIARMTVGKVMDFPLPSKEVMESIDQIKENMDRVKVLLEDPEVTTIRLVLIPERMAINETMRSYTYLCLYNKTVECLVINKVYPETADGEFLKDKLEEQKNYIREIHEAFDPLKIMVAYQMPTELMGSEKLDQLAEMIFGDKDPIDEYSTVSPMYFDRVDGVDRLHIRMPFVDPSTIELYKTEENALIVYAGSQKRKVSLPMTMRGSELDGAEFDDDGLVIKFRRH